jgi:hypothetical protein
MDPAEADRILGNRPSHADNFDGQPHGTPQGDSELFPKGRSALSYAAQGIAVLPLVPRTKWFIRDVMGYGSRLS